jgi:uncharacterized repeat protein (TIGR01451 family)
MKYSNIPNSVIAKYSRILTGIVFATTSALPLATSAIAVTASNPVLTITAETRTTPVPASSEVTYRITIKNTTAVPAYKVKITDVLPTGFTYDKELTMLTKGAVVRGTKPVVGANTLVWDNYTIPANGTINIFFTATASASSGTYSMPSLNVDYYSSPTSTTRIPTPASLSGTADDVTLKAIPPTPTLTLATSGSPSYDAPICAQPGAQGVGVELTGIVNTYFKPNMPSGGTITVGPGTTNTQSIAIASDAAKGSDDIKPGDLVLIVQMQDASIDTTNSDKYGSGFVTNQGSGQTSMGSTGLYEYAIANSTVLAASGSVVKTLTLRNPLINTYTSAAATTASGQKRFQVIRVPQYASAKVLGTMFASPWDGNVGGILAVDAFGTFDLNGQRISVNEAGFRGGFGLKNVDTPAQEGFVAKTNVYGMDTLGNIILNSDKSPQTTTTTNTFGSGKGEGVAGTPRFLATKSLNNVDPITKAPVWTGGFSDNKAEGYPGGDTGRGAPANAGGGANTHNAGGGGGGNGGNGGQGSLGYGFFNAIKDAGGRPGSSSLLNTPTPMKVFMGGGGGGGEANNQPQGVPGGAGGGVVMLRAGTIVGSGTIYANGTNGDRGAYGTNPDGAGGGGAGGTVLIQSRNPSSATILIEAKGGSGGHTERDAIYKYYTSSDTPATPVLGSSQTADDGYSVDGYPYSQGWTPHGPGGGGAGGIVLYNVTGSTATINPLVTGGSSGHTDDPAASATLAPLGGKTSHSHGATAGSSGQIVRFSNSDDRFSDLNAQTACSPANLAMVVSTSNPTAAPGDIVSYKMKVTNPASSGGATAVSFDNQLPTGFTYTSTPTVGGIILTGGATRPDATAITPTVGSERPTWGKFMIPPGATVEINFKATIGTSVANGLYHDKAHSMYPNPLRVSDTASDATITKSYGEVSTETGGDITVRRRSVPQVWKLSPTIRIVRR